MDKATRFSVEIFAEKFWFGRFQGSKFDQKHAGSKDLTDFERRTLMSELTGT